jgi:hypothetical protein
MCAMMNLLLLILSLYLKNEELKNTYPNWLAIKNEILRYGCHLFGFTGIHKPARSFAERRRVVSVFELVHWGVEAVPNMFDYHALTMNEPRDSPHKRQQFVIMCALMFGIFAYTTITAGVWSPIDIKLGKFPGGEFVYKSTKRDSSACSSLEERICLDLDIKANEKEDRIFSIFLDDPSIVTRGRSRRFASGFLSRLKEDNVLKNKLLAMNPSIQPPTKAEVIDLPALDLWERLRYKQASLPAAKAAVVHHPSTNGFVSDMLFSLRILPQLRKFATEKQLEAGTKTPAVSVISTCSIKDSMCTYYAPIEKGARFLLGQEPTEVYAKTLPPRPLFGFKRMKRWVRHTFGYSLSDEL